MPRGIGWLPQLQYLSVDQNRMIGKLPDSIANSTSIQVIGLSYNRFTALPSGWHSDEASPSLRAVDVSRNHIRNEFPLGLARGQNLRSLILAKNGFYGSLPKEEYLFPKTSRIDISRNNFSGPIPDEFETIGVFEGSAGESGIHLLDMSSNALSGIIPEFLNPRKDFFPTRLTVDLSGNTLKCGVSLAGDRDFGERVFGVECITPGSQPEYTEQSDRKEDSRVYSSSLLLGVVVVFTILGLFMLAGVIVLLIFRWKTLRAAERETIGSNEDQ